MEINVEAKTVNRDFAGWRPLVIFVCLFLATSNTAFGAGDKADRFAALSFLPAQHLGKNDKNPSTPFLRHAPDGRIYAVWTEDDPSQSGKAKPVPSTHQHAGEMAPAPMRAALLAWTADGGKTWSSPRRVNRDVEAIEEAEGGPKVAFGADSRASVVWSIPDAKGNKMRANIRLAMEDGKGGFTPARTLNDIKDTARFPIIESTPDNMLLAAWIDRRIDNPNPRQLYLMQISPTGQGLTKSYQIGDGPCECCCLGISFAEGGKTVYLVNRQVNKNIRDIALRRSTDGGMTFGPPVSISDDGWQLSACPHSGPSIGQDGRGYLHMTWFTVGRSVDEAGVYYTVSKDGGRSFAPRQLVHANTAAETLHPKLAVAKDGKVYFTWDNVDGANRAQVFMRSLAPDGTWGPVQQMSSAEKNASRPAVALSANMLHIAWTETEGEKSWVVLKSAFLGK